MRLFLKSTILIAVTCTFCHASIAQESELRERFMMPIQHQCPLDNLDEAIDLVRAQMAPILDAMLEDGE